MVTCDSLNIIISCLSVSADAGSASLNIPPLKKKKNSIFCITPFEDFPDIFPSSTDNPPGFVALLAYFYPEIDKH